jgi:AGZA family xanthine/uracil permease-like MFS transporter
MFKGVKKINWDEFDEAIPAFLVIVGMPLLYSIADGMALGFILYPLLKLVKGKGRELGIISWILFLIFLIFIISRLILFK